MSVALLFSGQGAQYVGMGKTFYENVPEVKALWDKADDMLGFDLIKIAFEGPEEKLTETRICQPALYVHGYSAYVALKLAGKLSNIKAALGLSLGEVTALAVAEVFDFETGLKIVNARGTLMQNACEITKGGMTSLIGGTRESVEALCKEFNVEIANLNCPGQIVISGDKEKITAATEKAKNYDFKRAISLNVAGAYHSRLMQPAANSFRNFLQDIPFKKPKYTVFTNTTGQAISDPQAIKNTLVKQVVASVLWEDCMVNATALGIDLFYECGPGKVLSGLAKRINKDYKVYSVSEFEDIAAVEKDN